MARKPETLSPAAASVGRRSIVNSYAPLIRSGSFSRGYARPGLVKHLGAARADAFLSRAFGGRGPRAGDLRVLSPSGLGAALTRGHAVDMALARLRGEIRAVRREIARNPAAADWIHRRLARAEARQSRLLAARSVARGKAGVAIAIAAAGAGVLLFSGRARADTPGSRAGSGGPVIDATAAVAVGATAAVGYGLYRRGRNLSATLSARPALAPAVARPAGMPAIPTAGPWSPRSVMPPLAGSSVTGIPRIAAPTLARPAAAPVATRPAGPIRKVGRALTGLAILNGASAGYDRGGAAGALTGALSGATFGLSDIALGMLPSRPATAGSDAGARSLAAARAASRDAGTAVSSAGSNPAARVAAATLPAGDGMTDAYTRTRNGRLENVAGYTTPARA